MKRVVVGLVALLLVAAQGAEAQGLSETEKHQLEQALACVNMSIVGLSWDKRPIDDPFRLAVVNRALDEPLSVAEMAEKAATDFAGDPVVAARSLGAWLQPAKGPQVEGGMPFVRADESALGATPEVSRLIAAAREARSRVANGIPDAKAELLRKDAPRLYLDESEEEWDSAPVREAAQGVRMSEMIAAFRALAPVAQAATKWTASAATAPRTWRIGGLLVVVGTPGEDAYGPDVDIVLDPGGDDLYAGVQFVVDIAGDDTYRDSGSGLFDAGLIVDLAGNDAYLGKNVAQGAAVCGASLLLDAAGDDRYEASQVSQGAGVLGIGMLFDLQGNDSYRGARFVQGFAGLQGMGVLADAAGNDTYWAGGVFKHEPLLPENYQSLSQGFAFGLRPDASGGVGVLADLAGNDSYHAEVYGQGASYWFALGMLVDSSGHDKYDLYQYGQGAGIHLSAGVLLDKKGSDAYSCNNGVAQGSGHDWAVGMLWDQEGNDGYQGSGMSQGGANANGIGMIIDRAGNDSYAGWNERNQGDSFPARGSVGLGVLLDMQGLDRYTHGGKDSATWTRGNVGVGRDVPEPPKPEAKP